MSKRQGFGVGPGLCQSLVSGPCRVLGLGEDRGLGRGPGLGPGRIAGRSQGPETGLSQGLCLGLCQGPGPGPGISRSLVFGVGPDLCPRLRSGQSLGLGLS